MSWYRQIDQRVYGDGGFRELSPQPPSGQGLWVYLLTGNHHVGLPGLFHIGEMGLAEALGWPLGNDNGSLFGGDSNGEIGFRECWAEIEGQGMAVADWRARVVFLPKVFKQHVNRPGNPNILRSWATMLDAIPEHVFKDRWLAELWRNLPVPSGKGKDPESFKNVFLELWPGCCSKGSVGVSERLPQGFPKGCGQGSRNSKGKGNGISNGKGNDNQSTQASPAAAVVTPVGGDKTQIFTEWVKALKVEAVSVGLDQEVVLAYVKEARAGLGQYYDDRGGRMTPTRLAYVAKGLSGHVFDIQMSAIEIFTDRHFGSKDEKYLVAIARKMARNSIDERERDVQSHRKNQKGRGLYAETQGSMRGGLS